MTAKELRASILDLAIRGKLIDSEGEWRTMKLSEACSSIVDCPHTTAPDQGEGYPLIRTSNVGFGKLLLDDVHRVSASVYKERVGRGVPEPGDLIFAREAPAGNIAVIAEGERVCLGQRTVLLKPKREVVDSKFLAYYVLSPSVQKVLVRKSIGSMVAHVNLAEIRPFQIQLPPLAEQKRIVEKIEQLMPLVERYGQAEEKRRQLITALPEALKKSILKSAVEGKLVPQDPNDEPAEKLLARIAAEKAKLIKSGKLKKGKPLPPIADDEKPFDLPHGWAWCRLGDVGRWGSGATPDKGVSAYFGGKIPWLLTGDLNDGHIKEIPNTITERALAETSVRLNPVGSVLIAMYGATIGKLGILDVAATTNQACCACQPYTGVFNEFLFWFLFSHRDAFRKKGEGGAQPNISKEKIVATLFPLPPLAEQKRIVAQIEGLIGIVHRIEK